MAVSGNIHMLFKQDSTWLMKLFKRVNSSSGWASDFRFDNVRIPRENLLNSVADVSPSGEYLSAIKNADQVTALFERCHFLLSPCALICSHWKNCSHIFCRMLFLLQRFGAFLAPLTSGRVTIAVSAVYISKVMIQSLFRGYECICLFFFFLYLTKSPNFNIFNIMPFIFCC